MKKTIIFIILAALFFCLFSCSKNEGSDGTDMELWLNSAQLDAVETPEELYEKALAEDTLLAYSISSRVMDVKASFEEQYPGLTVYVYDVRSSDEAEMLESNFKSRDFDCDVVICDDNDGYISENLIQRGIVYKYVPSDFADRITSENNQNVLSLTGEVLQAFYNSDVHNSPPVHNWWELTEERYKGKVVIINPLKSSSTMGFLGMTVCNNGVMEQAYLDLYGEEITLSNGETAGQVFWRTLVDNDLVLVNSGDEVVELVGAPGLTDPPIGIMISSKARMQALGYNIKPIFDMDIFTGTYSPTGIMLAGGSKNINSAKLFIRWILGETDGQCEGYQPYLQNGAWSVRTDVAKRNGKFLLMTLIFFSWILNTYTTILMTSRLIG